MRERGQIVRDNAVVYVNVNEKGDRPATFNARYQITRVIDAAHQATATDGPVAA